MTCCQLVDPLRATPEQSLQISTHSWSTWRALLAPFQTRHLPRACWNIKCLLNQTPEIPHSADALEHAERSSLYLEGFSVWNISSDKTQECDLDPIRQTLPRKIYIGESSPRNCDLTNPYFDQNHCSNQEPQWIGDYLSIFVLGWSYVLSVRLIELRRTSPADKVVYTRSMADLKMTSPIMSDDCRVLELVSDQFAEVRWWASILANGPGWQGSLCRYGKNYYPPWEIHLSDGSFTIHHQARITHSISVIEPPSSAEALRYLFNLARQLDAFDQMICGLSSALTLPSHNRFGAPITLPRPVTRQSPRRHTELLFADLVPDFNELPHLMAFSCTSGMIGSCLLGGLWEPGIPCNLTSQWTDGALEQIIPLLMEPKQAHPVILAMSERRPHLASLWLGAAVTGLLPRIFQVSKSYMPTVYPEVASWCSTSQSFMDPSTSSHITHQLNSHGKISREDEFRLLFWTDTTSCTYGNFPLSPYPPVGYVNLEDTAIEVRLHFTCSHRVKFSCWKWSCRDGKTVTDLGFRSRSALRSNVFNSLSPSALVLAGLFVSQMTKASICTTIPIQPRSGSLVFPSCLAIFCFSPRLMRIAVHKKILNFCGWMRKAWNLTFLALAQRNDSCDMEDEPSEHLSELATRALFSWMFFTEGTRKGEESIWNHDWLEILLTKDTFSQPNDTSSSASEDHGESDQRVKYIQKWQDDVSQETCSDGK